MTATVAVVSGGVHGGAVRVTPALSRVPPLTLLLDPPVRPHPSVPSSAVVSLMSVFLGVCVFIDLVASRVVDTHTPEPSSAMAAAGTVTAGVSRGKPVANKMSETPSSSPLALASPNLPFDKRGAPVCRGLKSSSNRDVFGVTSSSTECVFAPRKISSKGDAHAV